MSLLALGGAWQPSPPARLTSALTPRCRVRGSQAWLATRPSPLDSARLGDGRAAALLCYSRPRARGRSVYDSLAPFGKAWRTGANEPTVLELTAPAVVAGVALPPGRYAILTVPQSTAWTVLFHTFTTSDSTVDDPAQVFHTLREVGRGTMPVEAVVPPVEAFTIRPLTDDAGQAFVLEWGGLRARMSVQFRD